MAKEVVLAFFADEAAADTAVGSLKAWDKLDDDVKLNAIAVLAIDEDGKIKTEKLGGTDSFVKGFGLGLVAVVLLGPIGPVLAVPIIGGIVTKTHRKGVSLGEPDRARIEKHLASGQAAVAVLVKGEQSAMVSEKLAELGGDTETHEVSAELEAAAAEATANEPAA
jgi:hypothetical protein